MDPADEQTPPTMTDEQPQSATDKAQPTASEAAPRPAEATGSARFGNDGPPNPGLATIQEHVSQNKALFAMFVLRIIVIGAALGYLIPIAVSARSAYLAALAASLATSLLRLQQRLPPPQLSRQFAATVMLEDASHYAMYSLIFLYPPPLTLVMLPVSLFAALHSASYTIKLLDAAGAGSAAPLRRLVSSVEAHSQNMLRAVATAEIVILPYTVIMLFAGRGSLLVPFVYYRFLTLRYSSRRNPYSRAVFGEMRHALEALAAGPRCPAPVAAAVRRAVALVSSFSPPMAPPAQ